MTPWASLLGSSVIGILALYGVIWTNHRADERERDKQVREMIVARASALVGIASEAIGVLNGSFSWSEEDRVQEFVKASNLIQGELAREVHALMVVTEKLEQPAVKVSNAMGRLLKQAHATVFIRADATERERADERANLSLAATGATQNVSEFAIAVRRVTQELPKRRGFRGRGSGTRT